jgi:hypothetical protein
LETIADLQRRSDEAAKFIDLDRLGISPQCGFASTAAGNPLSQADQRAKLRLVVTAARAIWAEPGLCGRSKGGSRVRRELDLKWGSRLENMPVRQGRRLVKD